MDLEFGFALTRPPDDLLIRYSWWIWGGSTWSRLHCHLQPLLLVPPSSQPILHCSLCSLLLIPLHFASSSLRTGGCHQAGSFWQGAGACSACGVWFSIYVVCTNVSFCTSSFWRKYHAGPWCYTIFKHLGLQPGAFYDITLLMCMLVLQLQTLSFYF